MQKYTFTMLKANTKPLWVMFYGALKHAQCKKICYQLLEEQWTSNDCTDEYSFNLLRRGVQYFLLVGHITNCRHLAGPH